jgi:hypothetical protein
VAVDGLVLAVGHPEVEVVDRLGVAVVEVHDPAFVDVLLAELALRKARRAEKRIARGFETASIVKPNILVLSMN